MSIIITDQYKDLTIYHYDDFTTDPDMLNVRGVVKNDQDQVVCKTFGYTPEVVVTNHTELNAKIAPLITESTRFFKSYEGTLFRVWSYQGEWFLSTHRKFSASRSKWGCKKTYAELFLSALKTALNGDEHPSAVFNIWTSSLNPEKIYVCLLRTYDENRKVCKGFELPQLYIVGSFDRANNFAYSFDNPEVKLEACEEIHTITSAEELVDYVEKVNFWECQGVVVMNNDASSGKIVNATYDFYDKLRGNVANVLHRYVQLRWDAQKRQQFIDLYPEHFSVFQEWEQTMNAIVDNIFEKYIDRFVKHTTAIVPPDQFVVMKQLQDKYKYELYPKYLRVNKDHVWEILGTWQERDVNTLYKEFKSRERLFGNGNSISQGLKNAITSRQ